MLTIPRRSCKLAARIEQMSPEERDAFKLGPNLGGDSSKIYFKIFKRV